MESSFNLDKSIFITFEEEKGNNLVKFVFHFVTKTMVGERLWYDKKVSS